VTCYKKANLYNALNYHKQRLMVYTFFYTVFVTCFLSLSLTANSIDHIAEKYVKLALTLGEYEEDYVDAYIGPNSWKNHLESDYDTVEEINEKASRLQNELDALSISTEDLTTAARKRFLKKQLRALKTKTELLLGHHFSFDQESRLLFDSFIPSYDASIFKSLIEELDSLIPGNGPLNKRFTNYKKQFIIPADKIHLVFTRSIEEARKRTKQQVELPENEELTIELVSDKSWSAFNCYEGHFKSLFLVNTDAPLFIDKVIDMTAHEAYPGHHVQRCLIEQNLVKNKGWMEFSIFLLYSPQALIAEGAANYGVDIVFPPEERLDFEKKVLYPLAGIDPEKAEHYNKVVSILKRLSYAENEMARSYLKGEMKKSKAMQYLQEYLFFTQEQAEQRIRFIDHYRTYIANFNFGEDLIKDYIKVKQSFSPTSLKQKWNELTQLFCSPTVPSDLRKAVVQLKN
jgi:hypothetical protein